MKKTDKYHRWVEWSDDDHVYIGRCPDLFVGGCHGDDAVKVAAQLQLIIDEWEVLFKAENKPLPAVRTRPMLELV